MVRLLQLGPSLGEVMDGSENGQRVSLLDAHERVMDHQQGCAPDHLTRHRQPPLGAQVQGICSP